MWSGWAAGRSFLWWMVDGGCRTPGRRVPVCSGLRRGLLLGCRNSAKTVFKKSELAACCRSDSGLFKNNADFRQPRISSPPAESGDRQHTPHGLVFQGGRGGGYSTGRSLCSTLVENTICVLVRPNCWSSLMKWSSSMVERKATSMSME